MIISPIFYMGNKKKLISKGLVDLFPKNINTLYDVFAGSCVVSLNTVANRYIINDSDENLISLYNMFIQNDSEKIINHVEENIKKYGLPLERTKRNQYDDKDKIDEYKKAYVELRDEYNLNKNVLDFYSLMFYSFSQQFRFSKRGKFNMPFGNDYFSDKNKDYIRDSNSFFKKDSIEVLHNDFRFILAEIDNMKKDDFVYLDPPYLNTTAVYNEGNGWTSSDEDDLIDLCNQLTDKGIKFGMSNVFESKGIVSQHLIDWVNEKNLNVYTFDKFTYMACGRGNTHAKEVFICNY